MNRKLKVGAVVALLVGFAALFEAQQLKIKHLMAENADLRSQLGQMGSLQDTNEGLTQQLKTAVELSLANRNELLRLRGQGVRSRQLEQENAQLKAERQQLTRHVQQQQPAAISSEQGRVTAISEVKKTATTAPLDTTDLGPLELQNDTAVHFDLGGGTNCVVTPTALSDGNNTIQIKVGVTNADGTFSEVGVSRITARPGQHCSISVGDKMIALAVTLRQQ